MSDILSMQYGINQPLCPVERICSLFRAGDCQGKCGGVITGIIATRGRLVAGCLTITNVTISTILLFYAPIKNRPRIQQHKNNTIGYILAKHDTYTIKHDITR